MSNQLIASASLFRTLYDNKKDIYDVITEFIKAAILLERKWSFTSEECRSLVRKHFGFNFPDAVINSCLNKRLKQAQLLSYSGGYFSTTNSFQRTSSIQNNFENLKNEYLEIIQALIAYITTFTPSSLNESDFYDIEQEFNNYLVDSKHTGIYKNYIAQFILQNEGNDQFRKRIDLIEEGLILYTGVVYNPELNSLGSWKSNLSIYLDTEVLFSAASLNGPIYKQLFDDFNLLIKQVRDLHRSKPQTTGQITLKYFEEAWSEVDNFFYAAEKSIENNTFIDPSKTAMVKITEGCATVSDVVLKKSQFEETLKMLKITLDKYKSIKNENNLESLDTISKLKSSINSDVDDEAYRLILKNFSKINDIRLGESDIKLEDVKAIFLSESWLTQQVAFSDVVKEGIPLSTNLSFITEYLWFKLNKGFSDQNNLPSSFDPITKARLVLTTQLNKNISESYRQLKAKFESGEITQDALVTSLAEFKGLKNKAEHFNFENIEAFAVNKNLIDSAIKGKAMMALDLQDQKDKNQELRSKLRLSLRGRMINIKRYLRAQAVLYRIAFYVLPFLILFYIVDCLKDSNDTKLGVISTIFTFSPILPIFKFKLQIECFIRAKLKGCYKRKLYQLKKP